MVSLNTTLPFITTSRQTNKVKWFTRDTWLA